MSSYASKSAEPQEEIRLHLGGLSEGTRVLSSKGLVRVEKLRAGDRLVTRDLGMQTLRLIAERLVPSGEVIQIAAEAFEQAESDKPVIVAPTQRILVRDWRARAIARHSPNCCAGARRGYAR